MRLYRVAHKLELWRIQHGVVAIRASSVAVRGVGIIALGLLIFGASDVIVNHASYESASEKSARECFAVLNGEVKMLDNDTGEIARVTWSKVSLVGRD